MKYYILLVVIPVFMVSICYAETEMSICGGYHIWSQSGHTFRYSEVKDKEFNGWAVQGELSQWWRWFGAYLYGGLDQDIKKEIFPNWNYEAEIEYAGAGIKVRKGLTNNTMGYLGCGVNLTHMDNSYASGRQSESWNHFGPDVVAGVNYRISSRYFVTVNGRYTWNRMGSNVYGKTSFDPGGLRMWAGLGIEF